MKKKKTLLWFLVILVLLVGVYVVLSSAEKKKEEDDNTIPLAALAKDAINSITITKDGQTHTFLKNEENAWTLAEDSDFPMNQTKAEDMLDAISSLKAFRFVTEDKSSFATYGLNPAAIKVKAADKDSKEAVYNIGLLNTVTSGYYLNIDGTDQVYIVNPSFGEAFSGSLNELAQKEKMPGITAQNITGLTMKNGAESFTLKGRDENDTFHSAFYAWFIQVNGNKDAVPADTNKTPDYITEIYNDLYLSEIEDYKAIGEELKAYGLDEASAAKLSITYDETDEQTSLTTSKETTFYFGNKTGETDNDNTYVRMEGSTMVYLMSNASLASIIGQKGEDLVSKDLLMFDLDTVDGMDITADGQTHHGKIVRTATTDGTGKTSTKNTYFMDDKEVESMTFLGFYYSLLTLQKEGALQQAPQTTQPVELKVIYYRNTLDHNVVELELMPYDVNFYLARYLNGYYLINRRNMENITPDLKELLADAAS
ncbi:MAG: DUF4340 domain-containing protein [Christensenellales bacterium]